MCMMIGGLFYTMMLGSLIYMIKPVFLAASCLNGVGAALLWTGQVRARPSTLHFQLCHEQPLSSPPSCSCFLPVPAPPPASSSFLFLLFAFVLFALGLLLQGAAMVACSTPETQGRNAGKSVRSLHRSVPAHI